MSVDKRLTEIVPKWPLKLVLALPPLHQAQSLTLRELGIPEEVVEHMREEPSRSSTRARRRRALKGSALESPPPLHEYAPRLRD